MHKRVAYILSVAVIAASIPMIVLAATSNRQADVIKTPQGGLRLTPLYHGSVMLEFAGKVIHVDPGFRTDNLVTMDLELPAAGDSTPDDATALRARQ